MSYQVFELVDQYSGHLWTELSLVPEHIEVQYPPISFRPTHFSEWINLTKVIELDFDLHTFLYALSYYQPVHSSLSFNVTHVEQKLKSIMVKNNISDLYDLGMRISAERPTFIETTEKFMKYFNDNGSIVYMLHIKGFDNNSTLFFQHATDVRKFYVKFEVKTFSNFEHTKFNQQFIRYFNHSLSDEYVNFYRKVKKSEYIVRKNPLSFLPFQINPAGYSFGWYYTDMSVANYEFHLKGTFYKWIPLEGKMCDSTDFHTECVMNCCQTFRLASVHRCNLFYLMGNMSNFDDDKIDFNRACNFEQNLIAGKNQSAIENCAYDCDSDGCKQWIYEDDFVLYPIEPDDNRKIGLITVYYEDKRKLLMIETGPYWTLDQFLANVGGLLGLWLGGSIISFIHIIYFCCCYLLKACFKHWFPQISRNNSTVALSSYKIRAAAPSSSAKEIKLGAKLENVQESELYNKFAKLLKEQNDKIKEDFDEIKVMINDTIGKMKELESSMMDRRKP